MTTDGKPPRGGDDESDWSAPAEDLISNAAGAAAGLAAVPLLGPAAAFVAVGTTSAIKAVLRRVIGDRGRARAERFEAEVAAAIADPEGIEDQLQDSGFQEVLFQNFRRAMDAIDPSVLPALARLTTLYRGREPDRFFRGAGRLLQDLSAQELIALREILSACRLISGPVVSVVSWHAHDRWEFRFNEPHKGAPALGTGRHALAVPVLGLLERVGLLSDPVRDRHGGHDVGQAGDTQIESVTVEQLLMLVEPIEIDAFEADYSTELLIGPPDPNP